ncbi:MAG: YidC/Oxa1 family membrane protein insertase, partial [Bacteroidota bacterium]
DLSTYDSIFNFGFSIPAYGDHISLFTLLMAISTFVYTFYQQKSQPTAGANPAMKYIAYFMPIVLLIFLNNYASGLSLYYLTSNIISISQTLLIRRTINDEDLLAQMRDTQKQMKGKKGKKKSKSRLEKWVEGQQKKQQDMMKDRKKNTGPNRRSRRN